MAAFDQWMWLLRTHHVPDEPQAPFLRVPNGPSREALARMLSRHAQMFGDTAPHSFLSINPVSFFEQHYKTILRAASLDSWEVLVKLLPEAMLPLTARECRTLVELSRFWQAMTSSARRVRVEALEAFVPFLAEQVTWRLGRDERVGNEHLYHVEIDALTVGLPRRLPLIVTLVFDRAGSSDTAQRWTLESWHRLRQFGSGAFKVALNIAVGRGDEYAKYVTWARETGWLVCFDAVLLKEVFTADRYSPKIQQIFRDNIGLQKLNPYTHEGAVQRQDMFLGRDREIAKILSIPARDYLVVGSRGIGKSSLLKHLETVTEKSTGRKAVFLDCANIASPDALAQQLAARINPRRANRITIGQMPQMVRAARTMQGDPFLFLLDEADRLVDTAHNSGDWRLFSVLRELANTGAAHTVFAGYKVIYEAWQSRATPLFNFAAPIYLSVLPDRSARQLVEEPMAQIGVSFGTRTLVDDIVKESGCHPKFLQFFCSTLIEVLDQDRAKIVANTHLTTVRELRDYREFVLKPFAADADFSRLEQWLVLQLAQTNRHLFAASLILEEFAGDRSWLKVRDLSAALRSLELSGIIRATTAPEHVAGDSLIYTWTIPAFPISAARTRHLRREIEDLERTLIRESSHD